MPLSKSPPHRKSAAGFTLPAILVVVGALLIIAVASLLVVGIERNTSRAFSDRERANLAVRAGLEDVKGIFAKEASNDDFLILQDMEDKAPGATKDPAPYLYLARGSGGGEDISYRYLPLFSAKTTPEPPTPGTPLEAPASEDLANAITKNLITLPWYDPVEVSWIEIPNEKGKIVSRYAYWVEDLQSRVDAGTAGNTKDANSAHMRYGWNADDTTASAKFPAPGLNAEPSNPGSDGRDAAPPLDQVALYALDPAAGAKDESALDKTIIDGRKALISPDSVLAVSGIAPPLARGGDGRLADTKARSLEENLTAFVKPYDEQPVIPFAQGIAPSVTGRPKLNLNALLAKTPATAVDEMATLINQALPNFEERKGGFPEDYVKTIAASAIGYASSDNKPVVQMGSYRGLGTSPMISEILLDINYLGYVTRDSGEISMEFEFILFVELLNHTNLPITGEAAMSFEVALEIKSITPSGSIHFGELLGDPSQCTSTPALIQRDGRYWTDARDVTLDPGEYKFYKFATVSYTIDIGFSKFPTEFTLQQPLGATGLSMNWNDEEVERIPSIDRDSFGLTLKPGLKRYTGKAAIPGHSYATYPNYLSNMGDPRIAHFIRYSGGPEGSANGVPLSENRFPRNISPNRRNIRYGTIYSPPGDPNKLKVYGRVIPSEWPDGGHDAEVTSWSDGWSLARSGSTTSQGSGPAFDPTAIGGAIKPKPGEALTYLSDRGRYYSTTELGRIYDPIMWLPTFESASGLDSVSLRADGEPNKDAGIMPATGIPWPSVQVGNVPHKCFGGGNTLRIGRPEHPKFNLPANHTPGAMPSTHAARLLDLFHVGKSRSNTPSDREGSLVRIEGHVNINTATRDSLRAMAAGYLTMDPKISKRTSDVFGSEMAPPVEELTTLSAPTTSREADMIADAIIRGRPYTSPSELACAADSNGRQIFGNRDFYPEQNTIQWSDSAAEEIFGRVYEASTVRSRNFRVWVIGQALAPTSANNATPEILAETRRCYSVFADPGQRLTEGGIDSSKSRITILHENDF